MKENRGTIRRTEWKINGMRSVGRPKHRWRCDIVGQQGVVCQGQQRTGKVKGLWWRATFCSGRTQPRTEYNRMTKCVCSESPFASCNCYKKGSHISPVSKWYMAFHFESIRAHMICNEKVYMPQQREKNLMHENVHCLSSLLSTM